MAEFPKFTDDSTKPPGVKPVWHPDTFLAKYNLASKSYLARFDEALNDSPENAHRMRFDPAIMDPLRTRQRAVVGTTWHIEPEDPNDDAQTAAAGNIEKRIRRMPQLAAFLLALKEDIWYGRSACQVMYNWQKVDDVWGLTPIGSIPVNGDKLVYFYDGRVGIRVNAMYKGETVVSDYNMVHPLDASEREAFVVGIFEPEDSDFRKPYLAGAIKGMGLRNRLYWLWGLKNQLAKNMADYIQWFSRGLNVYQFDAHNANAEAELLQRIQQYQDVPFLLFPRFHDGAPNWKPVERFQADSSSAQFLLQLMEYYDGLIRSLILGQTFTTQGGPGGLGDGVATASLLVSDQVVAYDCSTTADYLTSDLVRIMYDYTYPGMPVGRWQYEIDSANVGELQSSIQLFTELGGKVGEDTLRKVLGIPDAKQGENLLGKIDTLDPAALGGTPTDTAMVDPANGPARQS